MKKILTIISLTIVCTLVFTACSKKEEKKTTEGLSTVEAGKLTICSDIPYAPFEFLDGKDVVGIDADLISAIAKDNSLEAKFVDTDFDSIFAQLKAGKCDVVASSVSITDERKMSNDFSDSYFTITHSLLVNNKDTETLTDLDKLSGKVIGVQSETTGADFAKESSEKDGYTVKEFTGADELLSALRAGSIDGVIQDYPINAYESTTNGSATVTKKFEGDEGYGFVISKDNPELTKAINVSLKKLKSNDTYDKIVAKYLGTN